jgi:hypothetical protein
MSFIISSLILIFSLSSWAAEDEIIEKEISYSLGIVNSSYQESQATLSGKNQETPASGAVSSISGMINYKFSPGLGRSYYLQGFFPLLSGEAGSYFGTHFGAEFYFGSSSGAKVTYNNAGTSVKLKPKMLYFWGIEGGLGYLVYVTPTAKKSDLLLEMGPQLGLLYTINDRWRLRAVAGYNRGIGVTTNTSVIRAFFGLTYFLD